MSGLLDKANTASQANETAAAAPAPVKVEPTPAAIAPAAPADENALPTILSTVGGVGFLVGLLLALQGGFVPFFISWAVLFGAAGALIMSDKVQGEVNTAKAGGAVAVALMIALVPFVAGALGPSNDSLVISEFSLDEDNDRLSFKVRGSFNEATVTIDTSPMCNGEQGVETVWENTVSLDGDFVMVKPMLENFYCGNAYDAQNNVLRTYTIKASDGDLEDTFELDAADMTRSPQDSGVRIAPVFSSDGTNPDGTTKNTFEGITIDVMVGLLPSAHSHIEGADHTPSSDLRTVSGDYTITLNVKKGASTVWTHPVITVDGLSATWSSPVSGGKSGDTNGWISLSGTTQGDLQEYVAKSQIDYDNGPYTFEVVLDMGLSSGGVVLTDDDVCWDLDFEEGNNGKYNSGWSADVC
jgi:hypothetical protein